MSGSNELVGELAQKLNALLASSKNFKLVVPHSYANPGDVDRLPEDKRLLLVIDGEEVNYVFDNRNCSTDLVSKALGSLVANDSAAWLVSTNDHETAPVAALVKIFDGDGWLVFGNISNAMT